MKSPCYGCTRMALGCHGTCKAYREYSAEQRRLAEEHRKERISIDYLAERESGRTERYRRGTSRNPKNRSTK